jgi:hypothetical protein
VGGRLHPQAESTTVVSEYNDMNFIGVSESNNVSNTKEDDLSNQVGPRRVKIGPIKWEKLD